MSHPRGPVFLGIPVRRPRAPTRPPRHRCARHRTRRHPTAADVTAAVDLLQHARRPALWIGGGAVASGADVDTLAWRLGAPVFATYAARGVLPPGHPLLVDVPAHGAARPRPAGRGRPAARPRLGARRHDHRALVAAAPAPRDRRQPPPQRRPRPRRHRRRRRRRLRRRRRPAARRPRAVGRLAVPDPRRRPLCCRSRPQHQRSRRASSTPIERTWPPGNPVVCDMAVAGYWVGGYAAVHGPRQLLYPVGWGTLGYGLPAALGVAASGTPTLAVVGDGGLAMATGELATLAQEHLPVTVLVVADGGYGMLRFDQQRGGHAERGVDLDPPDWAALGQAFGLPVERPADDRRPPRRPGQGRGVRRTPPRRLPRHALPAALDVPPVGRPGGLARVLPGSSGTQSRDPLTAGDTGSSIRPNFTGSSVAGHPGQACSRNRFRRGEVPHHVCVSSHDRVSAAVVADWQLSRSPPSPSSPGPGGRPSRPRRRPGTGHRPARRPCTARSAERRQGRARPQHVLGNPGGQPARRSATRRARSASTGPSPATTPFPTADSDTDDIPDQVEQTLAAVSTSWATIVGKLGFRAPLTDGRSPVNGGDNSFDVYLADTGRAELSGYTSSDDPRLAEGSATRTATRPPSSCSTTTTAPASSPRPLPATTSGCRRPTSSSTPSSSPTTTARTPG